MKLFLRFFLALSALFLSGASPLHAHARQQARNHSWSATTDIATHARTGSEQYLRQLSFRTTPSQQENGPVRIIAADSGDEDEDEDENGGASGKRLAAGPGATPFLFVPVPGYDGHSVSKGFANGRPFFNATTRRFMLLGVIRI